MKDRFILLVEDNPNDEMLTLRALQRARITNPVVVKHDGAEALEFLLGPPLPGQKGKLPILILLDLKLPKVDGLEVLERLRKDERTRLVPVVILTASVEETDLVRGYGLGANSYIHKPVDFEQFAQAIQQIGLYWLVLNQAPPVAVEGH